MMGVSFCWFWSPFDVIQWSFRVSLLSAVTSVEPFKTLFLKLNTFIATGLHIVSIIYLLSIIYHLKGKIPNESKGPLSIQI